MRDFGKAFSFAFKDPQWFGKFALAALWMLLALVGIGIVMIAGYLMQLTQRVIKGEQPELPRWDNLGEKFVLGLKYCIVYIVYLLPVLILMLPVIPLAVTGGGQDASDVVGVMMVIYLFGVILIMIPYSLAVSALIPIITYRLAIRERMSDALDIGAVFRDFRNNWQNTIIVALVAVGLQSFAGIGLLFFGVGIFFTLFYSYIVSAYLCAVLYRNRIPEAA